MQMERTMALNKATAIIRDDGRLKPDRKKPLEATVGPNGSSAEADSLIPRDSSGTQTIGHPSCAVNQELPAELILTDASAQTKRSKVGETLGLYGLAIIRASCCHLHSVERFSRLTRCRHTHAQSVICW